jgi:hypothetical protein
MYLELHSSYELFSECIAMSREVHVILHLSSYDSSSGGYFTQALLKVAARMRDPVEYSPCSIQNVLKYVAGAIK